MWKYASLRSITANQSFLHRRGRMDLRVTIRKLMIVVYWFSFLRSRMGWGPPSFFEMVKQWERKALLVWCGGSGSVAYLTPRRIQCPRRIQWTTMSKAIERSRRTSRVTLPLSVSLRRSSCRATSAVSVPCHSLNLDWHGSSLWVPCNNACNWSLTTLSINLAKKGIFQTGLSYSSHLSPD